MEARIPVGGPVPSVLAFAVLKGLLQPEQCADSLLDLALCVPPARPTGGLEAESPGCGGQALD